MIATDAFEGALCRGRTEVFFSPAQWWTEAAPLCQQCPCRIPCLREALDLEQGRQENERFGMWASLTPQQRRSLELRPGAGRCIRCGEWLDPGQWHDGKLRCPCGWRARVPGIPPHGDDWSGNTTKVARLVLGVLVRHKRPVSWARLTEKVRARPASIRRVLRALRDEGLVEDRGGWVLVDRDVEPDTWLPAHLRAPRGRRSRGTMTRGVRTPR